MATTTPVEKGRLGCAKCGTPVVRYPGGEIFPSFYCPKCDTGDWATDARKAR